MKNENRNKGSERLLEENINHQGLHMTIIGYLKARAILVQFDDGTIVASTYNDFKRGSVRNRNNKRSNLRFYQDKINKININNHGYKMQIIDYKNYYDITVKFIDGYQATVHTNYSSFLSGEVRNPNEINKYGGVLGNEKCSLQIKDELKKEYNTWMKMLERASKYDDKNERYNSYSNVNICDEWKYFPNFYNWIKEESNYLVWKNGGLEIDKDILSEDSKIYSAQTCCLIPKKLNAMIANLKEGLNEKDLPSGIHKKVNKYRYNFYDLNTKKHEWKSFDSLEEAYESFKEYKTNKIRKYINDLYHSKSITQKCYEKLKKYEYINLEFETLLKCNKVS